MYEKRAAGGGGLQRIHVDRPIDHPCVVMCILQQSMLVLLSCVSICGCVATWFHVYAAVDVCAAGDVHLATKEAPTHANSTHAILQLNFSYSKSVEVSCCGSSVGTQQCWHKAVLAQLRADRPPCPHRARGMQLHRLSQLVLWQVHFKYVFASFELPECMSGASGAF